MIRLIYYAIVAYLVYRLIRFFQGLGRTIRPDSARPTQRLTGTMVKDETCGTYLPKEEALREVLDGEERFFCSKDCRRKFLEEIKRTRG
jgi:YHS domain-containing protein